MKWVRRVVFTLVAGAALTFCLILGAGWLIAPSDDLDKADAIVVVSGGDTNQRVDEGVALWKAGWAPKLTFAGAAADAGVSNAAVMRQRAVLQGVPSSAILIEERSRTTKENAQMLLPIFEAQNLKKLILVSTPYHTRRVKVTFGKELGKEYHLIAHPAKDTRWAKSSWWEEPATVRLTWDELRKTFYVVFLGG